MENSITDKLEGYVKDIAQYNLVMGDVIAQMTQIGNTPSEKEKATFGFNFLELESKKFAVKNFYQYATNPSVELTTLHKELSEEQEQISFFKETMKLV